MNKLFILVALGTVSSVFANYQPYGQGGGYCPNCPGGRSGYYQDGSYDRGGYYDQNQQGYRGGSYQDRSYDQNQQGYRGSYQDRSYDQNQQSYNRNNQNSDQDINKQIQNNIGSGWFSRGYEKVSFDVNNGYVTLRGTVDSLDDKRKVEDKIRNINGVRQIDNQIQVRANQNQPGYRDQQGNYSNQGNYSDQDINKKIQDTVGSGWFSRGYQNVSFDVNNGNVTLRGTVDSMEDKRKIEDKVRKLDGVRQINNQILVRDSGEQGADRDQDQQRNYNNPSDQEASRRIHGTLSAGWLQKGYEDISYEINDGYVTLRGTVDTNQEKNDIQNQVENIDGVRSVDNKIKVDKADADNRSTQDFAATSQDQKINSDIRSKLDGGWFSKGFEGIILRTNNGIVVISGTVDSPEDIRKITDRIKDINGVRSVKNQLTVKNK